MKDSESTGGGVRRGGKLTFSLRVKVTAGKSKGSFPSSNLSSSKDESFLTSSGW